MPAVSLSPIFNGWQGFTVNGIPLNGGLINTYLAASSTPALTYTDNTGGTSNANPIVLNASGYPPSEIWLVQGTAYKFVLTDSLGLNTQTFDNISSGPSFTDLSASSGSSLIGFIQAGSGAVARTLQSKDREIVSITDFGAVGDGATDNSAAITTAIAAIPSTGGALFVPAGTFKFSSTISLKPNLMLFGKGTASVLSYTGAGVAVQAVGALPVTAQYEGVIRDLRITTATGTHGLRLKDLVSFEVGSIRIDGFSTTGLHLTGTAITGLCIVISIHNSWFVLNTGSGILADSVNAINQVSITNNRIEGNSGIGINIGAAGAGWNISGNDIEGNAGSTELMIDGGNCSGVSVSGNYFESAAAHPCIIVANTQEQRGISITGNIIQNDLATTNAIVLGVSQYVKGVVVQGNSFSGLATNGISIFAVNGGVFGPNWTQGSIVQANLVNSSSTGIKIFNTDNRIAPTYGVSITINPSLADEFDITATNNTAFTIANPTQGSDDRVILITVRNTSGGGLGAVTWDTLYKLAAWTSPANGFSRSISYRFNGTNWVEVSRTTVDVPN